MTDAPAPTATAARPLTARIATGAANVGRWALRRAKERSTWAGLAMVAAALGKETLSTHLGQVGDAVALIVGGSGVALAAATTTPHLDPAPADPPAV